MTTCSTSRPMKPRAAQMWWPHASRVRRRPCVMNQAAPVAAVSTSAISNRPSMKPNNPPLSAAGMRPRSNPPRSRATAPQRAWCPGEVQAPAALARARPGVGDTQQQRDEPEPHVRVVEPAGPRRNPAQHGDPRAGEHQPQRQQRDCEVLAIGELVEPLAHAGLRRRGRTPIPIAVWRSGSPRPSW